MSRTSSTRRIQRSGTACAWSNTGRDRARPKRRTFPLNRKLADDNASGELVEDPDPDVPGHPAAKVLDFPGRMKFVELPYGPFNQSGTLQGVVIVVGGESDPVPIHIQDGEVTHICRAKRPLAKELAQHLFATHVRVTGTGRWFRDAEGQWTMKSFTIGEYAVLRADSLSRVVEQLRQLPGKWKERHRDPLATLDSIRHGET